MIAKSTSMVRSPLTLAALALLGVGGSTTSARAQANPVILEWFENSWYVLEHRAPDLFVAGYNGLWLPPPSKASTGSPGYDVFDRFDLGSPASPTMYGTEASFRAMIQELKQADQDIYIDLIVNHNSSRTTNAQFVADGGWPGFYYPLSGPTPTGDFHNGTTQSTNPSDPNYNLWEGDLVSLIDIAQESNNVFIRHPVASNPQNLPAGNVRNKPDANNARFYPDQALPGLSFTNPANGQSWTIRPFNSATPLAGDAVAENATGLLMRFTQWLLDEFQIDGYRLDAAKHVPQWFWNNYFDTIAYQRRALPDGTKTTAYSFGESVTDNGTMQTYIRKDGFGNRDALDLNEAGQLRDIRNAAGFGSWNNPLNASVDLTDNGLQDGSQGVHHVFSHDNGSVGNGSSAPALPTPSQYAIVQNAYVLMRTGVPIVYFNGREMHTRFTSRGFWPREGNPTALGDIDQNLVRLVRIHNGYARGSFYGKNSTDPSNTSLNDVLIFERGNGTRNNVLVALNDRYDAGTQTRNVQTTFAPGTRLRELTGNASDPLVDPGDAVKDVLLVGNDGRLRDPAAGINGPVYGIVVPNNVSTAGTHHRGYVVYGPATPSGTLSVFNIDGVGTRTTPTNIAPDGGSVPSWRRRATAVPVITTSTFEVRLDTTKTDALDTEFDDFACFKIDQGFRDFNNNGGVDLTPPGATVDAGFERFLTQFSPISTNSGLGVPGTNTVGTYRQVIDTSLLSEGYHYLTVYAYRKRSDGGLPIFTDFRLPFYVDRSGPAFTLVTQPVSNAGSLEWRVLASDRTTDRVHMFANLAVGVDPLPLVNSGNQAYQYDRLEWRRNLGTLPTGSNSITVVAFEDSGNVRVQRFEGISITLGSGDVNRDGRVDIDDLYALQLIPENTPNSSPNYVGEGDMNADNTINALDRTILEQQIIRLRTTVGRELQDMKGTQR